MGFKKIGYDTFKRPDSYSEDEWNNLLIDLWNIQINEPPEPKKFQYFDSATGEIKESDTPISATITIHP